MQKHSFHTLARPLFSQAMAAATRPLPQPGVTLALSMNPSKQPVTGCSISWTPIDRAVHGHHAVGHHRPLHRLGFNEGNGEARTGRHVAFLHFHGLVTLVPAVPHPIARCHDIFLKDHHDQGASAVHIVPGLDSGALGLVWHLAPYQAHRLVWENGTWSRLDNQRAFCFDDPAASEFYTSILNGARHAYHHLGSTRSRAVVANDPG